MRYFVDLDDSVVKALRLNYNEYLDMMKPPVTRLRFVKQLKEDSGLGLKEAKDNSDIIFNAGIEEFRNTFGIKQQRRKKLDALKKRLLINELVEYIEKSNTDKIEEVFSDMNVEVVEEILNNFLERD